MTASISVVIPTYKEEKYIAQTLEALKTQTAWHRMEIVVADYDPEGNKKTIDAMMKCSDEVKRKLKIVNVNKNGIGYARHVGITHATGEYIVNFDSDSFFASPDSVYKLVSLLTEKNYNSLTKEYTDNKASHCSVVINPSELYNVEAAKFNMLYNIRNSVLSMIRLPAAYEQGLTLTKKTYWDAGGFKDVREFEGPLLCAAIMMTFGVYSLAFERTVIVYTSARRGMGSDGLFFDANYSNAYR